MGIFILYQTDKWKSKASRICFGIFDSRIKAMESAKWNDLYSYNCEVVIIELTINEFEEI
ncbi:hypothetical protein SAMN05443549_1052 [Flavobacterium fluvii]|uniref:Uncharacterized protein n=1 Tax=Flavobacterium fluvii TaxID=468056 RepID=A0A1M5KZR4_9FLAO|nr:hypothetical protein [Flavobacterium fluvii]SHG57653.1 hypothetical protein SAMN05443549_1052 [Flavobacterium fluvii]